MFLSVALYSQDIYEKTSSFAENNGYEDIINQKDESFGEFTIKNFTCKSFNVDPKIVDNGKITLVVSNLTVKFSLRTLFGEPVVDGVFKWEADGRNNNKFDYKNGLDYNDCLFLGFYFGGYGKNQLFVRIDPTVPSSGEDFGFNAPGSPDWDDLFYVLSGNEFIRFSTISSEDPRKIWQKGPMFNNVYLGRKKGLPTSIAKVTEGDDFWDTPENDVTEQDLLNEEERDARLKEYLKAKDKYRALQDPFTKTVKNNDTVYEESIKPLAKLDYFFRNAQVSMTSRNIKTGQKNTSDPSGKLALSNGWNSICYIIRQNNIALKDSVKVFYNKEGRQMLFSEHFDEGQNLKLTIKVNDLNVSDSYMSTSLGIFTIGDMNINPARKTIFETKYMYEIFAVQLHDLFSGTPHPFLTELFKMNFEFNDRFDINHEYDRRTSYNAFPVFSIFTNHVEATLRNKELIKPSGTDEHQWIKEKLVFDPSAKKIFVYINDVPYDPFEFPGFGIEKLEVEINAQGTYNKGQKTTFDYIKIYQE